MATAGRSVKDLRALPDAELTTQLDALRKELWQARLKATEGAFQQTHRLRELRRDVARVKTIMRERQRVTP